MMFELAEAGGLFQARFVQGNEGQIHRARASQIGCEIGVSPRC